MLNASPSKWDQSYVIPHIEDSSWPSAFVSGAVETTNSMHIAIVAALLFMLLLEETGL